MNIIKAKSSIDRILNKIANWFVVGIIILLVLRFAIEFILPYYIGKYEFFTNYHFNK